MSARGAVAGTRGVRTALVVLRGGEGTWIATVKVVEEGVEERVEEKRGVAGGSTPFPTGFRLWRRGHE